MKHPILVVIISALICPHTMVAVLLVTGDSAAIPHIFSAPITTKVFDRQSGTLFVGVDAPSNPSYALAAAQRPAVITNQKFQGIAGSLPASSSIEFLSLLNSPGCPLILPFVIKNGSFYAATEVSAIFQDGNNFIQTTALNDANSAPTSGIVQISASSNYIFAAVRPAGGNIFGDPNSGIALVNAQCLTATPTYGIALTIKDATTGFNGNKAQRLDLNSSQLGTTPVTINPTETGNINTNKVSLWYDTDFDRLYIGMRIQTGTTPPQIGKSVVIGTTSNTGLSLLPIVANGAISPYSITTDEMIVTSNADSIDLRALNLRVMHASTGTSYLIVNGGQGATTNVSNLICALPLVDDPNNPLHHGTLAKKNAPLSNFHFVTPASAPGDLAVLSDPAALVGTSQLPIDSATSISDLVVVGDTVYVSVNQAPSSTNDTGVFYSQALFNGDTTSGDAGKIIGWTPWTKRAAPINAFSDVKLPGDVVANGGIVFFDVDAKTGSLWLIEGTTQEAVGYTTWNSTGNDNDLIATINRSLSNGCYSALDLHQGIRGFTNTISDHDRYALFGGVNKVLFTRISQAYTSSITSPQTTIVDFSSAENSVIKTLPPSSGAVTVLEYSRRLQTEGATNYFFAGTQNGLNVFSASGNGFTVSTLSTLDQPPFSTGSWTKISTISGAIIDLKTSGKALYIVTLEPTAQAPLKCKVYSVPFAPTVSTMFAPSNVYTLAESGTLPGLQNTLLFTGIQIIDTADSTTTTPPRLEQLILATNNGLFASHADQTGNTDISDALDQTDAAWQQIATNDQNYFSGIQGIDSQTPHTTFPLQFTATDCQNCERSSVLQLNGSGPGASNTGVESFAPLFFNAQQPTAGFITLNPIISFFSDGARRFFINQPINQPIRHSALSVIPFDTVGWSVSGQTELSQPVLQTINRFFWILPIGMSGLTLAGTELGVVGLT